MDGGRGEQAGRLMRGGRHLSCGCLVVVVVLVPTQLVTQLPHHFVFSLSHDKIQNGSFYFY